jgi:hypothetical protein
MKIERVPFRNWDLVVWVNEQDGDAWVAVRPLAEAIGVDWAGQQKKLSRDPKFMCRHMSTPDGRGHQQVMLCLPVRQINGWLYGINSNRVHQDIRERLLQFQEECHIALHNHMSGKTHEQTVKVLTEIIISLQEAHARQGEIIARHERVIESLSARMDEMWAHDASKAGQWLSKTRRHKPNLALVQ